MRSASHAAARTYVRPLSLIALFGILPWIVSTAGHFSELSVAQSAMSGYCYAIFLSWLAVVLNIHLKQMLCTPTAKIIPNLQRAHLNLAGRIAVVFTLMVPTGICWLAGRPDMVLPLSTLALTLFVGAFLFMQFFPALGPLIAVSPLMFIAPALSGDATASAMSAVPSNSTALLLFSVSSIALFLIGRRLAISSEEQREFHVRYPATMLTESTPTPAGHSVGGWITLTPDIRNLRGLQTRDNVADETILERARHFNAAWRPILGALMIGIVVGLMELAYYALVSRLSTNYDQFFLYSRMTFMAALPAQWVCLPQPRRVVTERMMWPYSRTQFVRGFGFLLASACVICWFIMHGIPYLGFRFLFHLNPLTESSVRALLFSLATLPLCFGVFVWPWKSVKLAIPVLFIGLITPISFAAGEPTRSWPWQATAALCITMLLIGVGMIAASYRRWLIDDVE